MALQAASVRLHLGQVHVTAQPTAPAPPHAERSTQVSVGPHCSQFRPSYAAPAQRYALVCASTRQKQPGLLFGHWVPPQPFVPAHVPDPGVCGELRTFRWSRRCRRLVRRRNLPSRRRGERLRHDQRRYNRPRPLACRASCGQPTSHEATAPDRPDHRLAAGRTRNLQTVTTPTPSPHP